MNKFFFSKGINLVLFFLLLNIILSTPETIAKDVTLIPSPLELKILPGNFEITKNTTVSFIPQASEAAEYLVNKIEDGIGYKMGIINENTLENIEFVLNNLLYSFGKEAYSISVTPKRITIGAIDRSGFFYAVQTLLQLLPPELLNNKRSIELPLTLPCIEIIDAPKYSWRSFMLDSGRQFQSVDFIKRYLDYIAILKLNVFHWHLTEGQGWRIEIKKYPKLVKIGSKVAIAEEQQGFYSQVDIREIVKYANKLCITVVPEIDVPGHSEAAFIAYPELTCSKKPPQYIAYQNAIGNGYKIICGTNYYTYLNFPITPWSKYKEDRTFDMRDTYESNPSYIENPSPLVLGMGTCLWTDWNVKMSMIDQRVFPRILVLAEQMWNRNNKIPFNDFYKKVKNFYKRLEVLGINYGPALREEVPLNYKWE